MNIGGGKGVDLLSVEYRKAVSSLMLKGELHNN